MTRVSNILNIGRFSGFVALNMNCWTLKFIHLPDTHKADWSRYIASVGPVKFSWSTQIQASE